jgi:hypothetical protein
MGPAVGGAMQETITEFDWASAESKRTLGLTLSNASYQASGSCQQLRRRRAVHEVSNASTWQSAEYPHAHRATWPTRPEGRLQGVKLALILLSAHLVKVPAVFSHAGPRQAFNRV